MRYFLNKNVRVGDKTLIKGQEGSGIGVTWGENKDVTYILFIKGEGDVEILKKDLDISIG